MDTLTFWKQLRAHFAGLLANGKCDLETATEEMAAADRFIAVYEKAAKPDTASRPSHGNVTHLVPNQESRVAHLRRFLARTGASLRSDADTVSPSVGEPDITTAADGVTELRVYGFIETHAMAELLPSGAVISETGFARALDKVKGKKLRVRLNSAGGDVFAGVTIANMVRQHAIPIVVDGVAASIASVIAAASPDVSMELGATLMVHNPWSCACGDAATFRAEANILDKLESMLEIYAAKSGKKFTRQQWIAALDGADGADGTWWSGAEAVAVGIADRHTDATKQPSPAASARIVEERRRVAAIHGVKLPKSLTEPQFKGGAFHY